MRDAVAEYDTVQPSGEYLTFTLGSEEYGIDILKVREIRGYDSITKIANTPDFIKGVINLRGTVVPIMDLRIRFNLDKIDYNEFTVVVILTLNQRTIGMVVDGVSDVIALTRDQIRQVPELVSSIDTRYLAGLATVDDRMLILVDIARLMSDREIAQVDTTIEHGESAR